MVRKHRLIKYIMPCLMVPIFAAQCSIIASMPVEATPTRQASATFTKLVPTHTPVLPTATVVPITHTALPPTVTMTILPATQTSTPLPPPSTENSPFTIHQIKPAEGNLSDLLADEVKKAEGLGMSPVVYFDADW
jgi:hypothetical protein